MALRIIVTPKGETIAINKIIALKPVARLQFAIRDLYYFDIITAAGDFRMKGSADQMIETRNVIREEMGT